MGGHPSGGPPPEGGPIHMRRRGRATGRRSEDEIRARAAVFLLRSSLPRAAVRGVLALAALLAAASLSAAGSGGPTDGRSDGPSSRDGQVQAERLRRDAPKVFLDCHQCDMDYIRRDITFVNFVRDRKLADIHVMVLTQVTGSGGREYTLQFIGQRDYYDVQNSLKYIANQTLTSDEERRGLTRVLKMGLVPYAAKTSLGDFLNVSFDTRLPPDVQEDQWNSWVFNLGFSGSLSGESTKNFASVSGWVSGNRVTPERKLRMGLSGSLSNSEFDVGDGTWVKSTTDSESFSGLYVVSLDEHWSAGSWLSFASSSYSNIAFSINPAPAVEYNFFPYAESTSRQLRFLYRVGFSFNSYVEETIYDKMKETLLGQSLTLTFEMKQPWGNISSSLQGSNLLSDFRKNRLEFWGGLNLQLFRGLSLSVNGQYQLIRDQLSLPKAGATLEEILLQKRMVATSYHYGFSVGLSYTFGSIYTNVVNPRFGR